MFIDSTLGDDITATKAAAAKLEADGYDGIWTGETKHDPFLQMLQAAEATTTATIGTSIAIAFARTPMTLANLGYDLQRYSEGRFVLGLGSQVKPHIERRFSMTWSHPAARMREMITAIRAIWSTWQDGTPLNFKGDFYTHTLMTPFFSPSPLDSGPPPIYLAGVGDLMTEVAGEVADGLFLHPFTTRKYIDATTLPALRRGAEKAGKTLDDFTVCGPSFVTCARDEESMAAAVKGTKNQIAFYASTPAYRNVLELHGWGDLQPELTALSKQGRWSDMGDLITDEILHTFSVVGEPAQVGRGLAEKLGDVAHRLTYYAPYKGDPTMWPEVTAALKAA
jgi:probable F420-dependent oxidoreductase